MILSEQPPALEPYLFFNSSTPPWLTFENSLVSTRGYLVGLAMKQRVAHIVTQGSLKRTSAKSFLILILFFHRLGLGFNNKEIPPRSLGSRKARFSSGLTNLINKLRCDVTIITNLASTIEVHDVKQKTLLGLRIIEDFRVRS